MDKSGLRGINCKRDNLFHIEATKQVLREGSIMMGGAVFLSMNVFFLFVEMSQREGSIIIINSGLGGSDCKHDDLFFTILEATKQALYAYISY